MRTGRYTVSKKAKRYLLKAFENYMEREHPNSSNKRELAKLSLEVALNYGFTDTKVELLMDALEMAAQKK